MYNQYLLLFKEFLSGYSKSGLALKANHFLLASLVIFFGLESAFADPSCSLILNIDLDSIESDTVIQNQFYSDSQFILAIQRIKSDQISKNLNATVIQRNSTEKIRNLMFEIFGSNFGGGRLYQLAIMRRPWAEWLKLAGHPLDELNDLTKRQIIDVINEVIAKHPGVYLTTAVLRGEVSKTVQEVTEGLLGRRISGSWFYELAIKSRKWSEWLDLVKHVRPVRAAISEQVIIATIKALDSSQLMESLSVESMRGASSEEIKSIIQTTTGKNYGTRWLYDTAIKQKNWNEWLQMAGVSSNIIVEPTDQEIIEIIKIFGMNKRKSFLKATNIQQLKTNEVRRASLAVLGREIGGARLYQLALKRKPWSKWLYLAGFNLTFMTKLHALYSDAEIIAVLKSAIANDENIALNAYSIQRNYSELFANISKKEIGWRLSGGALYKIAVSRREWNKWLIEVGLDPVEMKLYRASRFTNSSVISTIQAINSAKIGLSFIEIRNNSSPELRAIIKNGIGRNVSGGAFYNLLIEIKSWRSWLSDAGLDITKIQLAGRIPYNLVNSVTRASLREADLRRDLILGVSSAYEGNGDDFSIVGVTTESPEDLFIRANFFEIFDRFSEQLDSEQQILLFGVISHLSNGVEISEILESGIVVKGITFSQQDIAILFNKMKQNKEFIEIFND